MSQFRRISRFHFPALSLLCLAACGGQNQQNPADEISADCVDLSGRHYISDRFEVRLESLESNITTFHYKIEFLEHPALFIADEKISGEVHFQCESGTYSFKAASINASFTSDDDFESIDIVFDRAGKRSTEKYHRRSENVSCDIVKGKSFSGTVETYFAFDPEDATVMFQLGWEALDGYYDCDDGVIHVHLQEDDLSPLLPSVHAGEMVVEHYGIQYRLSEDH